MSDAADELYAAWLEQFHARTPSSRIMAEGNAAGRIPASQRHYFGSSIPYPLYLDHGKGCQIVDIDGNRYIDCSAGWNAGILGWGNPQVADAVHAAMLGYGNTGGPPFPVRTRDRLTDIICSRVPGAEQVTFCVSGSEANAFALRFARAHCGRDKVLKFVGAYHGVYDELMVGTRPSEGLTRETSDHVILATFNDTAGVARLIEDHADELAAVFVEPILCNAGNVEQRNGFLKFIRSETKRHNVLMVMDEVITGWRFAMGGASDYYGITPPPDLVALGKMLGGGLPLGAVAGRRDILSRAVVSGNTNSFNPATHAAAVATLEQLTPDTYSHMNRLAGDLRDGLRRLMARLGLAIHVSGDGTNAGLHLVAGDVCDAETARRSDPRLFNMLRLGMLNRGMNWTTKGFGISAAFGDEDVRHLLDAFDDMLTEARPALARVAPELIRAPGQLL